MIEFGLFTSLIGAALVVSAIALVGIVAIRLIVGLVLLPIKLMFGLLMLPLALILAVPMLAIGLGAGLVGAVVLLTVGSIFLLPVACLVAVIWAITRHRDPATA